MYIPIRRGVAVALSVYLFPSVSLAQTNASTSTATSHEHEALEEIVVTASPLGQTSDNLSQSATVLQGEALRQQLANSLGETLARTPGIANASFGENVGRPVIRGLQGSRVGVLSNSMAVDDVSSLSQDHAVSVEPFLADQIEVLRGPSTLLYGSGAIGGVVNMVSPTIPQSIPENGYSGRVTAEGNSAADEEFAAGRLDLGSGQFALHIDGFHRRTDDYDIPGNANLYPEDDHDDHDEEDHDDHDEEDHDEHEEHDNGTLDNSFLKNQGWTVGGSWIGEQWLVGVAYTDYKSEYGIPGDAHVHEHEEEDHDEDEHEEEEHGDEEAPVTIDLKSQRTTTIEAGFGLDFEDVLQPDDQFAFKATRFRTYAKDFIDLEVNQPTLFVDCNPFIPGNCDGTTQAVNVPSALLEGNEIEATYDSRRARFAFGFSNLDGDDLDSGDKLGVLTPTQVTLDMTAKFPEQGMIAGFRTLVALDFDKVDDADDRRSGYVVHDAYFAWQQPVAKGVDLRLDLGVDNITDRAYSRVFNDAFEPGRNFKGRVGVTARW